MTWKDIIKFDVDYNHIRDAHKREEEKTAARIGRYIEYLHNQFKQKGIKGLNKQEIDFIAHQSQGM